jgi:hypothetical protein
MSENRDRASRLIFDEDVQSVLEFMQAKIVTTKLVAVADSLPGLARLLWGHYLQEPLIPANLKAHLPCASAAYEKRSTAIESALAPDGAGGGSVAAVCDSAR